MPFRDECRRTDAGEFMAEISSDQTGTASGRTLADAGTAHLVTRRRAIHVVLGAVWLGVAGWSLLSGVDYYRMPLFDRAYSDLHELYKPSGFVGHGYGIVGSLLMIVGVGMYSVRKRWKRMHSMGRLRNWLTIHIFLCTLGPFLVVLHTAFRFGGIISVAFWSMVIVVASGVFGRYVYVWIPKTVEGEFISESLLKARRNRLVQELSVDLKLAPEVVETVLAGDRSGRPVRLRAAIVAAITSDFRRRRTPSRFEKRLRSFGVDRSKVEEIIPRLMNAHQLQDQMIILMPFQRLFGYWHVFHLPLAGVMFLIMFLHIAVAITFGYYWIS